MRHILWLLTGFWRFWDRPQSARIKDVTSFVKVQSNPLMGTGLVTGLQNTGDSKRPSAQILSSLLRREDSITSIHFADQRGIALVAVTGSWDPSAGKEPRSTSMSRRWGDAKSLQGGMLLATELKGLDGRSMP